MKKSLTRQGLLSPLSSIYKTLGLARAFILEAEVSFKNYVRKIWNRITKYQSIIKIRGKNGWETLSIRLFENCLMLRGKEFGTIKDISIHHFSDATEVAYVQVSYFRLVSNDSDIYCIFLIMKF